MLHAGAWEGQSLDIDIQCIFIQRSHRRSLPIAFLSHRGRVTHICVSKLTSIASDNGLSPDRRQAIIWTNAGILLIGPLGTNFSEISIEILTFSFKKMRLKVSSAKRRPFCRGLNVLNVKRTEGTRLCTGIQRLWWKLSNSRIPFLPFLSLLILT